MYMYVYVCMYMYIYIYIYNMYVCTHKPNNQQATKPRRKQRSNILNMSFEIKALNYLNFPRIFN